MENQAQAASRRVLTLPGTGKTVAPCKALLHQYRAGTINFADLVDACLVLGMHHQPLDFYVGKVKRYEEELDQATTLIKLNADTIGEIRRKIHYWREVLAGEDSWYRQEQAWKAFKSSRGVSSEAPGANPASPPAAPSAEELIKA